MIPSKEDISTFGKAIVARSHGNEPGTIINKDYLDIGIVIPSYTVIEVRYMLSPAV